MRHQDDNEKSVCVVMRVSLITLPQLSKVTTRGILRDCNIVSPCSHRVMHAMVSDPGEARAAWAFLDRTHVDFCMIECVVLPAWSISGLNPFNLSAYGLHACCPTLKDRGYPLTSKDSLSGGCPALPERDFHPLENTTLPGRTYH